MTGRGRAIVLIGFMGSGKSATGRALARKTGWVLYDTDEIVSARFGKTIPEIFAEFGEEKFRDAETEALRKLSGATPSIVVTGGGIVLRSENVESLRRLGMIAHLEADEEILFQRVSRRTTRPLLQTEDPRGTLAKLLRERQPIYRQAADFNVETSRVTPEEVAGAIIRSMESL
jgi:shikimate kinase